MATGQGREELGSSGQLAEFSFGAAEVVRSGPDEGRSSAPPSSVSGEPVSLGGGNSFATWAAVQKQQFWGDCEAGEQVQRGSLTMPRMAGLHGTGGLGAGCCLLVLSSYPALLVHSEFIPCSALGLGVFIRVCLWDLGSGPHTAAPYASGSMGWLEFSPLLGHLYPSLLRVGEKDRENLDLKGMESLK